MEGNKGIPACPKYPLLPCHGLTEKRLLSELPYKLVPSTILIEKIAFMWTWKIKKFIFLDFTEYWKKIQAANQYPPMPLLVILSASEESRYASKWLLPTISHWLSPIAFSSKAKRSGVGKSHTNTVPGRQSQNIPPPSESSATKSHLIRNGDPHDMLSQSHCQ